MFYIASFQQDQGADLCRNSVGKGSSLSGSKLLYLPALLVEQISEGFSWGDALRCSKIICWCFEF